MRDSSQPCQIERYHFHFWLNVTRSLTQPDNSVFNQGYRQSQCGLFNISLLHLDVRADKSIPPRPVITETA